MSTRTRTALFLLGAAAFALLVAHTGPAAIARHVTSVGWVFVPILLLYGAVYVCFAASWHVVMAGDPVHPPFLRTWVLTVSAFALNMVTPVLNAGGEPFRMAAAARWLGARRAAGSVVLYTMLHAMSSLLLWFTALGVALVILPHGPLLAALIVLLMTVVAGLGTLVLAGHRGGVLERGLSLVLRLPGLRRFGPRLEARRAALVAVDRQIMDFYHRAPRRFLLALALDFGGRVLAVGEFYLICAAIGVPVTPAQAYLIGGLAALSVNITFFVPFELGSKEAGLFFIYHFVGLDPALGVTVSLITRVRELAWIATGIGLVFASGGAAETLPPPAAEG